MLVSCLFTLGRHCNFTAGVTSEQPDLLYTALALNIELLSIIVCAVLQTSYQNLSLEFSVLLCRPLFGSFSFVHCFVSPSSNHGFCGIFKLQTQCIVQIKSDSGIGGWAVDIINGKRGHNIWYWVALQLDIFSNCQLSYSIISMLLSYS